VLRGDLEAARSIQLLSGAVLTSRSNERIARPKTCCCSEGVENRRSSQAESPVFGVAASRLDLNDAVAAVEPERRERRHGPVGCPDHDIEAWAVGRTVAQPTVGLIREFIVWERSHECSDTLIKLIILKLTKVVASGNDRITDLIDPDRAMHGQGACRQRNEAPLNEELADRLLVHSATNSEIDSVSFWRSPAALGLSPIEREFGRLHACFSGSHHEITHAVAVVHRQRLG
jgi:hypothetical protein